MPKREPKAGDYYLLPFAGTERDLLVQAIEPHIGGHWMVRYATQPTRSPTYVLLSSCHRCPPSRAARILGAGTPGVPGRDGGQQG